MYRTRTHQTRRTIGSIAQRRPGAHLATVLLALGAAGVAACSDKNPTGTGENSPQAAQANGALATDLAAADASAAPANGVNAQAALQLPINQSVSSSGVAFGITQTGAGPSGYFKINNAASNQTALVGQTNGSGAAVGGATLGTGPAAVFQVIKNNFIHSAVTVGQGDGGSPALSASTGGTGGAGAFGISNPANRSAAVTVGTRGTGSAIDARINNTSNPSPALRVSTDGTASAIEASSFGSARAARLAVGASNQTEALLAFTNGSGFAARFQANTSTGKGVIIETRGGAGLQVLGGSKNAVVPTPSGSKALYTEESTEVWFTDYGFGKLEKGRARVLLDASFAQTINPDEPYHVFVQPYGRAELYVAQRTPLGFTVEVKDGDQDAQFSYRVVAKRLGFEQKRLEAAPWADQVASGLRQVR